MSSQDRKVLRNAPIAMSADEFRATGHQLVDRIAELLSTMDNRPVTPDAVPSKIRELLNADAPLPRSGRNAQELVNEAADLLIPNSLYNGHPRFWGYITSSPAPIGMLGDLLASAINPNLGGWLLSPMATEIEAQTVRWIAELIGYPTECGGLLTSGGNVANFIGFVAARAAKADWNVRQKGMHGGAAAKMRIYTSAETHTWLQKATDLFGFGTDAAVWVPVDKGQRMDLDALRGQIGRDKRAGLRPFMVIGAAGTVSTGAIDPLREISAICREHGLWFHVDGAYGGFAAALPEASEELKGLALADSVAVDPHKWLYAPLEAGCALVRDPEALRNAFSYHPPYYHFEEEAINYFDYGLQNSRGFRALKVWLGLQQVGRDGYEQMMREDCRLAKVLYEVLGDYPEIERFTYNLSIATFRFIPEDLRKQAQTPETAEYLNALNEALLDHLDRSGEAFVSVARINGIYTLRACVVNFRTTQADVEALPEVVVRLGREVDKTMRTKAGTVK